MKNKKGLTLIELLMAISLMSVVMIAGTSLYSTAAKFLGNVSDAQQPAKLLALNEMIVKDVKKANYLLALHGGSDASNTIWSAGTIYMRQDFAADGSALNTPDDASDDTHVMYTMTMGAGKNKMRRRVLNIDSNGDAVNVVNTYYPFKFVKDHVHVGPFSLTGLLGTGNISYPGYGCQRLTIDMRTPNNHLLTSVRAPQGQYGSCSDAYSEYYARDYTYGYW